MCGLAAVTRVTAGNEQMMNFGSWAFRSLLATGRQNVALGTERAAPQFAEIGNAWEYSDVEGGLG